MGDWTSLEAIMRDLSVAQGSCVPASIETFTAHAPPTYNIEEEESEEQKYYTCDADADASFPAPDFRQIQQMLRLVNESDHNEHDNLNGLEDFSLGLEEEKNKKKLKKNAALSSIMAAKEAEEARTLLIGDNIVQNMFKRKNVVDTKVKVATATVPLPVSSPPKPIHKYTPTARAKEYYNKLEEQNRFREQFQEDIWTKVERQMQEIDERHRREAERASLQGSDDRSTSASSSASGIGSDIVNLSCHRHEIEADCIVCIVACKHGYNF